MCNSTVVLRTFFQFSICLESAFDDEAMGNITFVDRTEESVTK